MKSKKPQTTSLNTKAVRLVIILNPKENTPTNSQIDYLQTCSKSIVNYTKRFKFIATQLHDKDKHENGEPKQLHLHVFAEAYEEQTLSAWLKELCELWQATKQQITIDTSNSEFLMVQYLTHQNDKDKAQYSATTITTNNKEELERRLSSEYVKPVDPIAEALKSCETLTEFMSKTDYLTANKFRGLFKDLHAENLQLIAYHDLETKYLALKRFVSELMQHLMLTNGRLSNLNYWLDYCEKLDIYDIINGTTPKK